MGQILYNCTRNRDLSLAGADTQLFPYLFYLPKFSNQTYLQGSASYRHAHALPIERKMLTGRKDTAWGSFQAPCGF